MDGMDAPFRLHNYVLICSDGCTTPPELNPTSVERRTIHPIAKMRFNCTFLFVLKRKADRVHPTRPLMAINLLILCNTCRENPVCSICMQT